jgi:hypothetical protein
MSGNFEAGPEAGAQQSTIEAEYLKQQTSTMHDLMTGNTITIKTPGCAS